MIKTRILPAVVAAILALPGAALAAGGESHVEDVSFSFEGPFGTYDKMQLQRGFQIFHNVCKSCHGLRYLAFRDLGRSDGPGFPEEQVKAIAAAYDVFAEAGEPYTDRDGEKVDAAELGDTRPGKPSDLFPAVSGEGTGPDLTLMAKSRAGFHGPSGLMINQLLKGGGGPEYIYSILTGYTGADSEVAGTTLYGNKAMPGGRISMPPPLLEGLVEYEMHGGGEHGDEEAGHEDDHVAPEAPEATVEQMSKDVSAFLMWAAEPTMVERKAAGFRNIVMIVILTVLLFYTNKKLWAPVKRKE